MPGIKSIIDQTQELILRNISLCKDVITSHKIDFLETIAQANDEEITNIGSPGKRLKSFADIVNLSHPDLSSIERLPGWDDFSSRLLRSLKSKENVTMDTDDLKLVRSFDRPKPRFIRDRGERERFRSTKKPKDIDLRNIYLHGENCLYSAPAAGVYICNGEGFEFLKSELQQKIVTFESRNMKDVAQLFAKHKNKIEEEEKNTCFGFCPLPPTAAALLVARNHGYRWADQGSVCVPFSCFGEQIFWHDDGELVTADGTPEEQKMELAKRYIVFKDKRLSAVDSTGFGYQPRLYPLTDFAELPARVTEIVDVLEKHPSLNGSPMFDYYWVVVPGINIDHPLTKKGDKWFVAKKEFDDRADACRAIDIHLVESNLVVPLVLGERDGKCYFVCLWA